MQQLVFVRQALSLLWTILISCIRVAADLPVVFVRIAFWKRRPSEGVHFYEGEVSHIRREPFRNAFRYPVRLALVDLEDPPTWFRKQGLSHMSATEARAFAQTEGPVKLLTNPEAAGYVQNPISVYYCYAGDERTLATCIAEVTNTPWGDMVRFNFHPGGEDVPKSLHVSPFMDMRATWHLSASDPSDRLVLSVLAQKHPAYGDFFDAHLIARRADGPCQSLRSEEADLRTLVKFGYMPQRVACLIYWQALKLLWKGATFYSPPDKAFRVSLTHKNTSHPLNAAGCPFHWVDATGFP